MKRTANALSGSRGVQRVNARCTPLQRNHMNPVDFVQCVPSRNAMMKAWILMCSCALFASAATIASPQNASENAASETSAVLPHGPDVSTPDAATATSDSLSPTAIPAQAAPSADRSARSLYIVEDGNKVDAKTLAGWKTWRALACERCHGAAQEGLVGPALVDSLKVLTKDEFHTTIMNGRPAKGMPPFSSSKTVTENWEGLYAYLKGRSDGRIPPGRLAPLDNEQ